MKLRQFNIDAPNAFEETDMVVKTKDLVTYLQARKTAIKRLYDKKEQGELLTVIKFIDDLLDDVNLP
jgi:hypothetical protein